MLKKLRIMLGFLLVALLAGCATASPTSAHTQAVVATDAPSSMPECVSLLAAVKNQDVAITQACLQQGQDVNQPDAEGLSPLNYAATFGNIYIVADLLAAGAEVNYQDPWGMTSLHAALKEGHDEVVLLLLEHDADVNLQTTGGYYTGFSPLHTAIYFEKTGTAVIEELLKMGADVNAADQSGQTPLQMASQKGLAEIEALLIQYGAKE